MSDKWRNEPATERQKEKLRFFGCTWCGDITVGKASDALEECAKQFPGIEAAYQNRQVTGDPLSQRENSELPSPEVTIQNSATEAVQPSETREGFFSGESSSAPTDDALLHPDKPQSNSPQEVTIQEAAKPHNTSPIEYNIPAREVQDFAQRQAGQPNNYQAGQNRPATEIQKVKLRFFCCTWDEGITEKQASDEIENLVKQFPTLADAYNNHPATPEQLDELRRYGKASQAGLPYGEAKELITREQTRFGGPLYVYPRTSFGLPSTGAAKINYSFIAARQLETLLADLILTDGNHKLPIAEAAKLLEITAETRLGISQCRQIAEKIESIGYCVEPDARYGGGSYGWDQTIGLFKRIDGDQIKPSPAYIGAANLLRLCVLTAAADGQIDEVELDVFRQVIENQLDLTQTDHRRLQVLEKLLVQDPSSAAKTLAKIAKSVPPHKRLLIGKVLVRVAAADSVITKDERRALERIFKAFEILPDTLENLIHQACPPSQDVTIQETGTDASGQRIPKPVTSFAPRDFALDMAKVYSITNETKEVVGILSVVMQDEPEDSIRLPKTASMPVLEIPKFPSDGNAASQPTRFSGLDAAFHPVLERLLARDSWPQADFNVLAREFHFMPLNIRDTLNEWADEVLGDFILDGEDPVVVHRELIAKETI